MNELTQDSVRTARRGTPPPRPGLSAETQLARRIERAIRSATADRISELRVEVDEDAIALRGRCGTFYTKQLAQHAAMALAGLRDVSNTIAVA